MHDPALRADLESVWREEVLPVFDAHELGQDAREYLEDVRKCFENPFLDHRLADIERNHEETKPRRFGPVVERARRLGLAIGQPRLTAALRATAAA